MKKTGVLLFLLAVTVTGFAKEVKVLPADELNPAQRKKLSEAWVETGQAYLDAGDKKNAKASLNYAVDWYPMGSATQQARTLLRKHFGISSIYNADKEFAKFVKRAGLLITPKHQLNNYLMALEVREDQDILYKVAEIYFGMNDYDNAALYIQKAVGAGYPVEKVSPSLTQYLDLGM